MKKAEKLFVYLLTNGTEAYGGMEALKRVDSILNRPEGLLWRDLMLAIEQQHRVNGKRLEASPDQVRESVQRQMYKLLKDD